MDIKTAEETLDDYLIKGLATEIFFANEAKSLCVEIGNHADQVNTQGYGQLFGSIQQAYSDRQTLCITKMYDPKPRNPCYKTRSIPTILSLIKDNASLWSLPQKNKLQEALVNGGFDPHLAATLNNTQISLAIVEYFESSLPYDKGSDNLSRSLASLKEARDKVIAHNEAVPKNARTLSTWAEAESLVTYAKNFVTLISFGFLSLYMGNDSSSYRDVANTRGTYIAMRQLLQKENATD